VRRGTAIIDTSAIPEANSLLTASTPRTTSTSCPMPKPVSAVCTAMSARGEESVPAAASQPVAPTTST
jgi:hypothetical protein